MNKTFSGVSFDTSLQDLISQIPVAMQVFANGVEAFISDPENGDNIRWVRFPETIAKLRKLLFGLLRQQCFSCLESRWIKQFLEQDTYAILKESIIHGAL